MKYLQSSHEDLTTRVNLSVLLWKMQLVFRPENQADQFYSGMCTMLQNYSALQTGSLCCRLSTAG